MGPDGSDRLRLYESCCMFGGAGFGVQGPVWSPDGTQILLMEGTGGGVWVIDAETGEAFEIPGGSRPDRSPGNRCPSPT